MRLLKTLQEKDKMLLFSILYFSHNVSALSEKEFLSNTHLILRLLMLSRWKIDPFPNKPWFLRVCSTILLKTLREKKKLLVTSNFSFSHSVFYLFGELSAIFNKLELSSANSFSLEESKICRLGKG